MDCFRINNYDLKICEESGIVELRYHVTYMVNVVKRIYIHEYDYWGSLDIRPVDTPPGS